MNVLFLIGRILFGGFFIQGAYNHFTHVKMMAAYAGSKKVPAPEMAVLGTGLLLLLGGLSILLGAFPTVGLILLIVFLVPTTFTMHAYWLDTDPGMKMGNTVNFYKNLALLGAILIMFIIPKPWPLSIL
jgi:putative oxidoreductase